MYQLVQKEAFSNVQKLKKENEAVSGPNDQGPYAKKGYQPLRNDGPPPVSAAPTGPPKKTQNMWQIVDDGFGSSRDFSNITGMNAGSDFSKEQQMTMKRDYM